MLPETPQVSAGRQRALDQVIEATVAGTADLATVIRTALNVDLSTMFAGRRIPHPIGKASGQLSCTAAQVREDLEAGVAFVVLKTVIAENERGHRSMAQWAERQTRMRVEPRESGGRSGWTVTWTGRGWYGGLDTYASFCDEAFALSVEAGVPVVPSVKYHLPGRDEPFDMAEYQHTTRTLEERWRAAGMTGPFTLEKDFSPTLAGDGRARDRDRVLRWVSEVAGRISAGAGGRVAVGLKLMNSLFDDAFQAQMFGAACEAGPAYVVAFNRLFDVDRRVAYGGWELSDRNLAVLGQAPAGPVPVSATGNICSGRVMLEYALRGCENGQVHTFFQVPRREYLPGQGGRSARALRTLLLHPREGLVPWVWHCESTGLIAARDGVIHFADAIGRGALP